MEIFIALLALIGTFYQLHLQRVHNEKSLIALPQINVFDQKGKIAVALQNNGVGPLIVDQLYFYKNDDAFPVIKDVLNLDPRTYLSISIDESVKKVLLPGNSLEIFSTQYSDDYPEENVATIRQELAQLRVKATGRDIYNNIVTAERGLAWFQRNN